MKLKEICEDSHLSAEEKVVGIKECVKGFINTSKENIQQESNYSIKDDNLDDNIVDKITTNILKELNMVNTFNTKIQGKENAKGCEYISSKYQNLHNKGNLSQ